MHRIFSAATLLQLKSGAKVGIKKAPLKRGANTPRIPRIFRRFSAFLRRFSASKAKIPRHLFGLARQKSSGERSNFD